MKTMEETFELDGKKYDIVVRRFKTREFREINKAATKSMTQVGRVVTAEINVGVSQDLHFKYGVVSLVEDGKTLIDEKTSPDMKLKIIDEHDSDLYLACLEVVDKLNDKSKLEGKKKG